MNATIAMPIATATATPTRRRGRSAGPGLEVTVSSAVLDVSHRHPLPLVRRPARPVRGLALGHRRGHRVGRATAPAGPRREEGSDGHHRAADPEPYGQRHHEHADARLTVVLVGHIEQRQVHVAGDAGAHRRRADRVAAAREARERRFVDLAAVDLHTRAGDRLGLLLGPFDAEIGDAVAGEGGRLPGREQELARVAVTRTKPRARPR